MTGLYSDLGERLKSLGLAQDLDLLVVIGAGKGDDFAHWRALSPKRLWLCEPQQAFCEILEPQLSQTPGARLLPVAIVAGENQGEPAPLYCNRLLAEASLFQPSDFFTDFWPNAGQTRASDVQTMGVEPLLQQMVPHKEKINVLILDAPGLELELLKAMGREALLYFNTVVVRSGEEPLYQSQSASCRASVLQALGEMGFKLHADEVSEMTPHVSLWFEKDALALELESLREEVLMLRTEKTQLEKRAQELEGRLGEAERGREEQGKRAQELETRQLLFNEELAKAEGQIELIKDLLLRDNARL